MAMTNKALRTADLATTGAKTIADRALRVAREKDDAALALDVQPIHLSEVTELQRLDVTPYLRRRRIGRNLRTVRVCRVTD